MNDNLVLSLLQACYPQAEAFHPGSCSQSFCQLAEGERTLSWWCPWPWRYSLSAKSKLVWNQLEQTNSSFWKGWIKPGLQLCSGDGGFNGHKSRRWWEVQSLRSDGCVFCWQQSLLIEVCRQLREYFSQVGDETRWLWSVCSTGRKNNAGLCKIIFICGFTCSML